MKIGCHLSNEGSISDLIFSIIELGGNAIQIFVSNPNARAVPKPIQNPKMIQQMLKNTGVFLVIHGKYIYNFCRITNWQKDALVKELETASQLGPNVNVVIHQGKNLAELKLTHEEALQTYANNLKTIISRTSGLTNKILLENSCQQGTEIGYTLEDLGQIYSLLTKAEQKRVGFCLDTCHVYVAGELEMKSVKEVQTFFAKFDKLIGLENLNLIHLNDSKTKFHGKNDHHGDLLHGFITNKTIGGTEEGLKEVVQQAKKHDIPLILETPMEKLDSVTQIKQLQSWSEG
jgi:apurinic endonuclease APN1